MIRSRKLSSVIALRSRQTDNAWETVGYSRARIFFEDKFVYSFALARKYLALDMICECAHRSMI